MHDRNAQVHALLKPIVVGLGYEFWGMQLVQSRGHSVLRIFIELSQRYINADDCVKVSKAISVVLDETDPISENYDLEVSSPGLDCPLFSVDQFARFVGEEVRIETHLPKDGRKRWRARIVRVDADDIDFVFDKSSLRLRMAEIAKAEIIPDYSKPAPVRGTGDSLDLDQAGADAPAAPSRSSQ
jgi:ribosome maturation factor RimP